MIELLFFRWRTKVEFGKFLGLLLCLETSSLAFEAKKWLEYRLTGGVAVGATPGET